MELVQWRWLAARSSYGSEEAKYENREGLSSEWWHGEGLCWFTKQGWVEWWQPVSKWVWVAAGAYDCGG